MGDQLLDMDAMIKFLEQAKPTCPPGTRTEYHYLTFGWLLAGLVKGASGEAFADLFEDKVTSKLGISDEMLLGLPDTLLEKQGKLAVLEVNLPSESTINPGRGGVSGRSIETGVKTRVPLLSPALFNMRKVRAAEIPAANLHCTARALARFYAGLASGFDGKPSLLGSDMVQALCSPTQETGHDRDMVGTLDSTPDADFGLGMHVYDFARADGQGSIRGVGHAGLGGSVGFALPQLGVGVAVTVNQLEVAGRGPREVISLICEELKVIPPESLVGRRP